MSEHVDTQYEDLLRHVLEQLRAHAAVKPL